jgi:hypothetical protein
MTLRIHNSSIDDCWLHPATGDIVVEVAETTQPLGTWLAPPTAPLKITNLLVVGTSIGIDGRWHFDSGVTIGLQQWTNGAVLHLGWSDSGEFGTTPPWRFVNKINDIWLPLVEKQNYTRITERVFGLPDRHGPNNIWFSDGP